MKQYLEILQEILDKGTWKEPAREGMPKTIDRFSIEKRFDLQEGFPLLTTKKMYWKGILHELIWMLRGDTNIKYLVYNNVNIWNQDAYKYYVRICNKYGESSINFDEFIDKIKISSLNYIRPNINYCFGDLGPVYGKQWRNWIKYRNINPISNKNEFIDGIDQIQNLINSLKENPYSRYHIVTAWNPSEMFEAALPTCHVMFQMNCRKMTALQREDFIAKRYEFNEEERLQMNPNATDDDVNKICDEDNIPKYYLDCKMVQRSCDTFLGVPFNIAQYGFLTHIIAKLVNMVPGEFIWSGNSVHIYENHIDQVKEQLTREPIKLPELKINANWKSIDNIKFEDFEIVDYQSHPPIKGELSVGV